jgi:hypothetical protein
MKPSLKMNLIKIYITTTQTFHKMDRLFQLKVSEFAIRNGYTITVSEYDEGRFSSLDEIPVSSLEMKDHILKIHVAPDDLDLLFFIDKKTFPEWMKNLQIDAKDIPSFLNNHFDQTTQFTIYELVLCMKRFHVIPSEPQLAGYMTLIPEPEVPDESQLNADIEEHKKVIQAVLNKDPSKVNPHDLAREKEEVSHRTIYLKSLKAENKAILARREEVVKQNEEIKKRNKHIEEHNQNLKNHYEEVMDVFRETEAFVGLLLYRRAKSMRGYTFKDAKQRLRLFSSRNAPKRALVEDVLIPKSPPNKYIKMEACGHSAGHVHHHVMPVVPPSPPRRSSSPPTPPPTPPPVVVVETKTPDTPPPDVKETKKPDTPPPPPVVDTNKPDTPPLPIKNTKDPVVPDVPVIPDIPVIPTKPPVPPPDLFKNVLKEMEEKKGKPLNATTAATVISGDNEPFIYDGSDKTINSQLAKFRTVFDKTIKEKLRPILNWQKSKAADIWSCVCVLWFHMMLHELKVIRGGLNEEQRKWMVGYFGGYVFDIVFDGSNPTRNVGINERAFYESLLAVNMDDITLALIQHHVKDVLPQDKLIVFKEFFPRILELSFFSIDISWFAPQQSFYTEIQELVRQHNKKPMFVGRAEEWYVSSSIQAAFMDQAITDYNTRQSEGWAINTTPPVKKKKKKIQGTSGDEDVTMDASI